MNRVALWLRRLLSRIYGFVTSLRGQGPQGVPTSEETTETKDIPKAPVISAAPPAAPSEGDDSRWSDSDTGQGAEGARVGDHDMQPHHPAASKVEPAPEVPYHESPQSEKARGIEPGSLSESQGQQTTGEPTDSESSPPPSSAPSPVPTSPVVSTEESQRRHLPPEKRGGRPRGTGSAGSRRPTVVERSQKPELVCWRQGMNWAVGLAVPEETAGREWVISQASSVLEEDSQRPGRWALTSPLGAVEARNGNGDHSYTFPEEPFRIFKLFGPSRDRGTYLQSLTCGRFLVVAPADWELKTENPGIEFPIAPEYLVGMQWRAHHVKLSQRSAGHLLMLVTSEGTCEHVPMAGSAFDLEGDVVHDADPDAGPLFRGEPPRLRCLGGAAYEMAVVGEEGPREQSPHWRESASDFEELRPAIAGRGSGWFFARFYDQDDRLIESLDFRFSPKLQSIRIHGSSPMPGPEGHNPALVDIFHDDTIEVTPADENPPVELSARKIDTGSRISIPPSPCYDLTRWLIKEKKGAGVEICLRTDRVWWCLLDEQAERFEGRWTDRALALQQEDLSATSHQVLYVRLPPTLRTNEVCIGIEPQRSQRPRPVAGQPDEVELPCRELGRFAEAERRAVSLDLKLWIRSDVGDTPAWLETLLARVPMVPTGIGPSTFRPLRLQSPPDPVRVMQILTRVRRRYPRYKKKIDELRRTYYRPIRRRRHSTGEQREAFVSEALCLLALVIEESEALGESPCVPSRWARRANLVRALCVENVEPMKSRAPAGSPEIRQACEPR